MYLISDLDGQYAVNKLKLKEDILIYNAETNLLTGEVFINELIIDNLKLPKNTSIQDVDVLAFFKNAVVKDKSASMSGKKTFSNKTIELGQLR